MLGGATPPNQIRIPNQPPNQPPSYNRKRVLYNSRTKRLIYALLFVLAIIGIGAAFKAFGKSPEDIISREVIKKISNLDIEFWDDDDEHRHEGDGFRKIDHLFDPTKDFNPIDDRNHPWYGLVNGRAPQQGTCGSCASFAVAYMLSDRYSISENEEVNLSPQSVLDSLVDNSWGTCDGHQNKCNCGTSVRNSLDVCITTGVAVSSSCDTPYRASRFLTNFSIEKNEQNNRCPSPNCFYRDRHVDPSCRVVKARDWKFTKSEEEAEEILRKTGTLTAGIRITRWFHNNVLNKEVLNPPSDEGEVYGYHAVCIVGVTSNYWIVRNSWGTSVHTKGFFRLKKGVNALRITDIGFQYAVI